MAKQSNVLKLNQRESPRAPVPDLSELGISGTSIFSGLISEEITPELMGQNGLRTWQKMHLTDATAAALEKVITYPIRSARWTVEPDAEDDSPEQEQMAEFIDANLWEWGSQYFDDALFQALTSLRFGFAPMELVWMILDDPSSDWHSHVVIDKFAWRNPITRFRWDFQWVNDRGGGQRHEFAGMLQHAPPDFKFRYIPADKLLVFTHDKEGDNLDGMHCALDTPVVTPEGWSTIGSIKPGDRVYDETGAPRVVIAKSPVYRDLPCYEVVFRGGETIVTSDVHPWLVTNYNDRKHGKPARVMTTEQMYTTHRYAKGQGTISNWAVKAARPLRDRPVELPVHPYVLGYWLGDGCRTTSTYSCAERDADEIAEHMRECGYEPRRTGDITWTLAGHHKGSRASLRTALGKIGVLYNKHIPRSYLRGRPEDRLALLQGLMDSDGSGSTDGTCVFTNCNSALIDGVLELLSSLGCHVLSRRTQKGSIAHVVNGHSIVSRQETQQIFFSLPLPAFRLQRKAERQARKLGPKQNHFYIKAIRPCAPVPVQCISVDAPSHLFLVGRQMIPTHNSIFRPAYKHWRIKDELYRIQAIGLERNYMGVPVFHVPQTVNDQEFQMLQNAVKSVRADENLGLVLPSSVTFDYVKPELTAGAMQEAITHHDQQMTLAILAQFLKFGLHGVGSYALSQDSSALFLMAINAVADSFEQKINLEFIPKLIEMNFANYDPQHLPKLRHGDIGRQDLSGYGRALAGMAQFGLLTPDEETENALREDMGLPEMKQAGPVQQQIPITQPPTGAMVYQRPQANGDQTITDPLMGRVPRVPTNVAAPTAQATLARGQTVPGLAAPKGATVAKNMAELQAAEDLWLFMEDQQRRMTQRRIKPSEHMARRRRVIDLRRPPSSGGTTPSDAPSDAPQSRVTNGGGAPYALNLSEPLNFAAKPNAPEAVKAVAKHLQKSAKQKVQAAKSDYADAVQSHVRALQSGDISRSQFSTKMRSTIRTAANDVYRYTKQRHGDITMTDAEKSRLADLVKQQASFVSGLGKAIVDNQDVTGRVDMWQDAMDGIERVAAVEAQPLDAKMEWQLSADDACEPCASNATLDAGGGRLREPYDADDIPGDGDTSSICAGLDRCRCTVFPVGEDEIAAAERIADDLIFKDGKVWMFHEHEWRTVDVTW